MQTLNKRWQGWKTVGQEGAIGSAVTLRFRHSN